MTEFVIECWYDFDDGWIVGDYRDEIVRCRDCACLVENDTFYDCKHFNSHLYWNEGQEPDGFCKWGERRSE